MTNLKKLTTIIYYDEDEIKEDDIEDSISEKLKEVDEIHIVEFLKSFFRKSNRRHLNAERRNEKRWGKIKR